MRECLEEATDPWYNFLNYNNRFIILNLSFDKQYYLNLRVNFFFGLLLFSSTIKLSFQGIEVERVEFKDVRLPVQLQRAMATEAEAAREARAKVIDI